VILFYFFLVPVGPLVLLVFFSTFLQLNSVRFVPKKEKNRKKKMLRWLNEAVPARPDCKVANSLLTFICVKKTKKPKKPTKQSGLFWVCQSVCYTTPSFFNPLVPSLTALGGLAPHCPHWRECKLKPAPIFCAC
jgi:hypothetical protein